MQLDQTLKEKIDKLPVWVKDLIRRLNTIADTAADEIAKHRREHEKYSKLCNKLKGSNEALLEILRCSSKGGMPGADAVVRILDSYEIYKDQDEMEGD